MSVPPRPLLGLCLLSAALVAGLLAFGATDRVTTAPGSVRPAGEARPLQVTRAGRIHDWLPRPHASVRRGELLGRLDTREEALRLHAMTLALAGLGADEARLTALLAEFGPETCPGTACAEALPLDEQHARERTLEREERAAARARIASLEAERAALLTRRGGLEGQARWLRPACQAHRELARRGGIAEVAHWESERRCAEDAGALATLDAEAATLTTRLAGQAGEERRRRAAVRQQWGRALAAAGRERQALVAERALL
jgi:multidrug efflux pump subunit AcrA (membrane-fusion protein)